MRCLNPVRLNEPDYVRGRSYTYVPCGKCIACLSNRRREWAYRLGVENRYSTNAYFITLTYDDAHLPRDGLVNKRDCQLFLKRLRKYVHPYKLRFFLVSEYGGLTGRAHYHMLLFNWPLGFDLKSALIKTWPLCSQEQWNLPDVIGHVTDASINYCAKYCLNNSDETPKELKTFMLCSRRPGIGSQNINGKLKSYVHDKHLSKHVYDTNGFALNLPRYHCNKLFNDEEKEQLKYISYEYELQKEAQLRKKYPRNWRIQQLRDQQVKAERLRKNAKQ